MTRPQRIQRRRTRGWTMPEGAVFVGRPTKWGNPFRLGTPTALMRVPGATDPDAAAEYEGRCSAHGARHDYHHPDGRHTVHHVRYMTRAECVEHYRRALVGDHTPSMRMAYPSCNDGWLSRWNKDWTARILVNPDVVRAELAGKDLACWCPPWEPCHADVLLEIANGGAE